MTKADLPNCKLSRDTLQFESKSISFKKKYFINAIECPNTYNELDFFSMKYHAETIYIKSCSLTFSS